MSYNCIMLRIFRKGYEKNTISLCFRGNIGHLTTIDSSDKNMNMVFLTVF